MHADRSPTTAAAAAAGLWASQRCKSKRAGNAPSHSLKGKKGGKNVNLGGIERVYCGRQYLGIRFIDVKPGNVAVKLDTFSSPHFAR